MAVALDAHVGGVTTVAPAGGAERASRQGCVWACRGGRPATSAVFRLTWAVSAGARTARRQPFWPASLPPRGGVRGRVQGLGGAASRSGGRATAQNAGHEGCADTDGARGSFGAMGAGTMWGRPATGACCEGGRRRPGRWAQAATSRRPCRRGAAGTAGAHGSDRPRGMVSCRGQAGGRLAGSCRPVWSRGAGQRAGPAVGWAKPGRAARAGVACWASRVGWWPGTGRRGAVGGPACEGAGRFGRACGLLQLGVHGRAGRRVSAGRTSSEPERPGARAGLPGRGAGRVAGARQGAGWRGEARVGRASHGGWNAI